MAIFSRPVLIALPALALLALVFVTRSGSPVVPAKQQPGTTSSPDSPRGTEVGAVERATTPGITAQGPAASPTPVESRGNPAPPAAVDPVGSTPAVAGDSNPQVRSIVEAVRSGTHAERLTPLLAPEPYDHQRFLANPQAYVSVVEPGRVYQSATPGEGVPQLNLVGVAAPTIRQGEQVELAVRTAPMAPATFTSFECGAFSNHLTSITVQADANGLASTTFTAPPGTLYDVNVLAGSPLASGQVSFCVTVEPSVASVSAPR